MTIFILPAISSFIILIWIFYWIFAAIFIFSVGTPEPRENYPFVTEVKWDVNTRLIFIYHVFGLLWINAFIIGCAQFIVGASASIWYFEVNTDTKGQNTLVKASKWLFRYHLGSIAFGSFVIAVCQMIRLIFEYYRRKMGSMSKEIKWVKVMLCLTGWILWLLEHVVKYMTKNAYIQIALTNKSFFPSAWNAFALMIKNAHRFGFGNAIGTVYILFGCMLVSSITTSLAYLFLTTQFTLLMITSPIPATVCVAIISVTISYLFMSVFSFSSDAILQSFLLDEELRFAGNSRPEEMEEFAKTLKSRGKGCCSFSCL